MGDDFGRHMSRWYGGVLAADGVIYCIPSGTHQVFAIDPLGEFEVATETNMEEHPEELGFLFRIDDTARASNRTYIDCAATKFGMQKLLEIMQECMPPANEVCAFCGLYPLIIAASYNESPLSVVYFLLRQVPFLINRGITSAVGNTSLKRKRSTTYT